MNQGAGIAAIAAVGWVERSDTHLIDMHYTEVPGQPA